MNTRDTQQLEHLLEKLNKESSNELVASGHVAQDDLEMLTRLQTLYRELRSGEEQQAHYCLSELRRLAKERRRLGAEWDMPDHLASCSSCLEAYQIILEGIPHIDTQMFHCIVDDTVMTDFKTGPTVKSSYSSKRNKLLFFSTITLALLIIILSFVFKPIRLKIKVNEGEATTFSGRDLFGQTEVRSGELIRIHEPTQITLTGDTVLGTKNGSIMSFIKQNNVIKIILKRGQMAMHKGPSSKSDSPIIVAPFTSITTSPESMIDVTCKSTLDIITPDGMNKNESLEDAESINSVKIHLSKGNATIKTQTKIVNLKAEETIIVSKNKVELIK